MNYLKIDYCSLYFKQKFQDLKPKDIYLHFYQTNQTGKNFCLRNCSHCSMQRVSAWYIEPKIVEEICSDISSAGYRIKWAPTDSYSDDIYKLKFIPKFIEKSSWTSGSTIIGNDWEGRLKWGYQKMGFRSITFCGYGIGENKEPFSGVINKSLLTQAISNVHLWNQKNKNEQFKTKITFTIRNDNFDYNSMERMIRGALDNHIDSIRFQCFVDYREIGAHKQYEINNEQIEIFFKNIKLLFPKYENKFSEIEVSGNLGDAGIKNISHLVNPKFKKQNLGICPAGFRMFTVIKQGEKILIVGCDDRLLPKLGTIEKNQNKWQIKWDYISIEKIRRDRLQGKYYGCLWGIGYNGGHKK